MRKTIAPIESKAIKTTNTMYTTLLASIGNIKLILRISWSGLQNYD